jgi:hypothetical protein
MLGAAKQGYGSSLHLTGPYTTWHEPLTKKISLPERLRWSTVVAVLALCYFLHHLPVLVSKNSVLQPQSYEFTMYK